MKTKYLAALCLLVTTFYSCTKESDNLATEKLTNELLAQKNANNPITNASIDGSMDLGNVTSGVDPCITQLWKDFTKKDPNVSSNYLNCISPENRDDPWGFESGGGIFGRRGPIVPAAEPCFDCSLVHYTIDDLLDLLNLSRSSSDAEIQIAKGNLERFDEMIRQGMLAYHQKTHTLPKGSEKIKAVSIWIFYQNGVILTLEDQKFLLEYMAILNFPTFVLPLEWYNKLYAPPPGELTFNDYVLYGVSIQ